MEQEIKKAVFALQTFKIDRFSFKEPEIDVEDLSMDFLPKGEYISEDGIFNLSVGFISKVNDETEFKDTEVLSANIKSVFVFPEKPAFQELPVFFYRNSIAILYPYLRAFVSTLTLQSNTKLLILPILNLVAMEQRLRDNTIEVKNK